MTDPNDLTTIAPEFNDPPALAFFDLVTSASTTHKSRYALRVAGLDAEGFMRCLVLTWDGVWHRASPTTGNIIMPAGELYDHHRALWNGKIVLRMPGAFMLTSDPPKTIFYAEDGSENGIAIPSHTMLEVLP